MRRILVQLGAAASGLAAMLAGPPPVAAEPALRVSVSDVRLAPDGPGVVLTGRYVCGPYPAGSDGVVDLTVAQAPAPTGYGYLYLTVCDGSVQDWSAPADSTGGQFVRGRAQVSWSGYACDRDGAGCSFGSAGPLTLRIR